MQTSSLPADISAIERPSPQLLKYYLLTSLVTGPLFPIVFLPQYFKYYTLRYRFDDEGISMRWGILFRREIVLNYARIQDIHLRSNIAGWAWRRSKSKRPPEAPMRKWPSKG